EDTTDTVFKRTKTGLDMLPITHTNDLFAGETRESTFLLDGDPAKNLEPVECPGGNRDRDVTDELNLTTDDKGVLSVTWPTTGMYWLEAELKTSDGVKKPLTERRAVYSATLEVLAP